MLRGPQGPGCAVRVDQVIDVGWGLAMDSSICVNQYLKVGSEMDREPVQGRKNRGDSGGSNETVTICGDNRFTVLIISN